MSSGANRDRGRRSEVGHPIENGNAYQGLGALSVEGPQPQALSDDGLESEPHGLSAGLLMSTGLLSPAASAVILVAAGERRANDEAAVSNREVEIPPAPSQYGRVMGTMSPTRSQNDSSRTFLASQGLGGKTGKAAHRSYPLKDEDFLRASQRRAYRRWDAPGCSQASSRT